MARPALAGPDRLGRRWQTLEPGQVGRCARQALAGPADLAGLCAAPDAASPLREHRQMPRISEAS